MASILICKFLATIIDKKSKKIFQMFYIDIMIKSVGYNSYTYTPNFKSRYEQPLPQQDDSVASSGLSVMALYLMSQGINLASEGVSKALMRGKEYTSPSNVQKVVDNMINNGKLKGITTLFINPQNVAYISKTTGIPIEQLMDVANGKNAFYMDSANLAVAPTSKPSLIQHELGHAINAKSKFWKAMQNSRRYIPNIPAVLLLTSILAKKISGSKEDTFIDKHAGKLGFAAYLPTIIEEAMASIRGIQAAKKTLGGNAKLGPLRRNYFLAWLTYLLAGIGFGAATKISVKTGIL